MIQNRGAAPLHRIDPIDESLSSRRGGDLGQQKASRQTQKTLEYISRLACVCLVVLLEEVEDVWGEGGPGLPAEANK